MKPADCYVGQHVRFGGGGVRIVESIDGDWAQLIDPATGARSGTRIQHLEPADDDPNWQERVWAKVAQSEPVPTRRPRLLCWIAIAVLAVFVSLHVWAAIRIGRGGIGLSPAEAAIAIGSAGAGWTAWFVTLLWMTWSGR